MDISKKTSPINCQTFNIVGSVEDKIYHIKSGKWDIKTYIFVI